MTHSETLFEQAQKYIPGGVNSPVRAVPYQCFFSRRAMIGLRLCAVWDSGPGF